MVVVPNLESDNIGVFTIVGNISCSGSGGSVVVSDGGRGCG